MYNTDSSEFNTDTLVAAEVTKMTSLGANETVDNYADNSSHNASIEEIFHLITQYGYSNVIRPCLENRTLLPQQWPKQWM